MVSVLETLVVADADPLTSRSASAMVGETDIESTASCTARLSFFL
jgi:hypothetical protein